MRKAIDISTQRGAPWGDGVLTDTSARAYVALSMSSGASQRRLPHVPPLSQMTQAPAPLDDVNTGVASERDARAEAWVPFSPPDFRARGSRAPAA